MQRRKRWSSRIATIALSAAMVFTMTPSVGVMAATTDGAKSVSEGLCEHHPEHTADCGYVAGTEGTPCTHVHTDDCYDVVEDCVHAHKAECYPKAMTWRRHLRPMQRNRRSVPMYATRKQAASKRN